MTLKEALDWVENVFEEHHVQLPDVKLTLIREAINTLERAKKVEELLDLYHLKNNYLEDYYSFNSLRGSQKAFDNLKDVNEEINLKEKELEEMECPHTINY